MDYHEKENIMNSEYYLALLELLVDEIEKTRPHLKKKKVLFHQSMEPYHNLIQAIAKLYELKFELLPHPEYSPDSAIIFKLNRAMKNPPYHIRVLKESLIR